MHLISLNFGLQILVPTPQNSLVEVYPWVMCFLTASLLRTHGVFEVGSIDPEPISAVLRKLD
jgi:hypothetical protein